VVGSLEDAYHLASLTEYGVTHILNLTSTGDNKYPDSFVYLQIPPKTSNSKEENLEDYFPDAKEFIAHVERMGGRVLVHCHNGMSRSPAVVLRYLIDQHELLLLPIFTHLTNCRPVVDVSDHFKLQLALFEHKRLDRSSVQRNAGKEWDFYEWNRSALHKSPLPRPLITYFVRIKHSFHKQKSVHVNTLCCSIQ
jgi:serine/threonine/tyrosine-interacting protein